MGRRKRGKLVVVAVIGLAALLRDDLDLKLILAQAWSKQLVDVRHSAAGITSAGLGSLESFE